MYSSRKGLLQARDGEEEWGAVAGWFCAVTARIGRVIVSGGAKLPKGRREGPMVRSRKTISLSSTSKNAFEAKVSEDRMRTGGEERSSS